MRQIVFISFSNNNPGVLARVAALFSRRGYNIDSITAGITNDPKYTRITVAVSGDNQILEIFYQEDCNLSLLDGKTIAIIGYGSQGHAHALNLKESGCNVIIGLYEGSKSWKKAEEQGFKVYTAAEAAKQADIIMILINDEKQAETLQRKISSQTLKQVIC